MRSMTALIGLGLVLTAGGGAAAQDAAAGTSAFGGRCAACHTTAEIKSTAVAPSLKGVFGRKIAALSDYNYSPALKAKGAGGTWTAAQLDTYLASPVKFDPGGKMFTAVTDAGDRANIIAYLKTTN